jgi:toxin ParE1/3/4
MPLLLRSEEARSDLLTIWLHVAERNPDAASRLLREIDKRCRLLADNPMLGRARADLRPKLRSFAVGSYLIFYRPLRNGVEIVRVLHGAREQRQQF